MGVRDEFRPHSNRVLDIKKTLRACIHNVNSHPGRRFMSNRTIARRFKISYQTADLLVRELASEGLLDRRPASGTYVSVEGGELSSVLGD